MSLIQEALKRRTTETGRPVMLSASNPPPAPPPLPPPPPSKPRSSHGLIALLVVLLIGLLGYCGWWFFLRPSGPPVADAKATAKPAPTNAVAGQPGKVVITQPSTNVIAQAKAKLLTTVTPERTELVMGQTNTPEVRPTAATSALEALLSTGPATSGPPVVASTSTPPPVVSAAPPAAPPPPPAKPEPVRWPKLNITGIMGRSGGDSVAFINGQLLKAGDSVAGARILTVTENSVQLVFQGETNIVRVGKGSE